ncbi:MAG: S8 family serine peptidase [Planctomycetota bacterium]
MPIRTTIAAASLLACTAAHADEVEQMADVLIEFATTPTPADIALVESVGGRVITAWTVAPGLHAEIPFGSDVDLFTLSDRVVGIELNATGEWHTEYDATWGVSRINGEAVHAAGQKGTGVGVAVLDSGLRATHEDIAANFVFGYDFEIDSPDFSDPFSHGTHTSGTVGAALNGTGVVGAAPEADLYMLKIGTFFPSTSGTINALQYVLDNDIPVTTNSYGLGGGSRLVEDAFQATWDNGTIHFASSGNGGGGSVSIPARYDTVIAVGATDDRDRRAGFSQGGPDLELVAPGVDVLSTTSNSDSSYDEFSGTSMASPHAAGVAALVIAAGITDENGNGRINDEIRQRLIDTAIDLGATGKDNDFGYGLVNAEAAIGLDPVCTADLNGDGVLDIFDFLAFQNLFDAGDPAADFNGDGVLNIFDFLEFQNFFVAGCP